MSQTVRDFSTKFIEKQDVVLKWDYYPNGIRSLQLFSLTGELLAVPSVSFDHMISALKTIEEEEQKPVIFIKDYTENTGMVDALVKAGIIQPLNYFVPSGFVKVQIFAILVPTDDSSEEEEG